MNASCPFCGRTANLGLPFTAERAGPPAEGSVCPGCGKPLSGPWAEATADAPVGDGPSAGSWVGRVISHYRVERLLGAGGMGEVYLAHDRALGRPDAFTATHKSRLLREAWASARLQHPAIATFLEAGEHEGVTFIAMEYVEGQTLRERLHQGPLPPAEALAVAECLLAGLGHAHAAGVLHRDIKPENVMLAGERAAKLLDFGLAKAWAEEADPAPPPSPSAVTAPEADDATADSAPLASHAGDDLTAAGTVVGTLGYMSPEQVLGRPVDARSDLFLVGAVLFEMLTGRRAFPGKTPCERFDAVLLGERPRLGEEDFPPGLDEALARALARDPEGRYPTAAAFLADLRRISTAVAEAGLPDTAAVLDFRNHSRHEGDDWLGNGLAEGLAGLLAVLSGVQMVPRPRVLEAREAFAGSDAEFGLHLGCRWLVVGDVDRTGGRLQVGVRLIDVPAGQEVCEERREGSKEQLLTLQRQLADALAARLRRAPGAAAPGTHSVEAYECCARGRQMLMRSQKDELEQARALFERAVGLDPSYAPALGGLAGAYAYRFPSTTDPRDLEQAERYARRAIAADPTLAEGYVYLGYALSNRGKPAEAYTAFSQATERDPSNFTAWYFVTGPLIVTAYRRAEATRLQERVTGSVGGTPQGRPTDPHRWRRERAVSLLQRAVALNPRHSWSWISMGVSHLNLGHGEEARFCLGKAVEQERQGDILAAGASGVLGECLRRLGRPEEARMACLAGLAALEKTDHMYRDTLRGLCLCALGRTALQQGDQEAGRAAFNQAVQHLRGRPRGRAAGHALVQALAGLTRAGAGSGPFEEGLRMFQTRTGADFQVLWFCADEVTYLELSRAARALGRDEQARALLDDALDYGSQEAREETP
jgi:serine/threonine protein kinase/Tfp pilus assembly protein PilF